MKGFLAPFFLLTNTALTIIVGMGIYSFSGSIFWAVVGALIITGSVSANPLFALLGYPGVELIFNNGDLTIYAAASVGITAVQMGYVLIGFRRH